MLMTNSGSFTCNGIDMLHHIVPQANSVSPLNKAGLCVVLTAMSLVLAGAAASSRQTVIALDGSGQRMPRPAVILLWAKWCAACTAELRRTPQLADAARPLPLLTLAIDPPQIARAALGAERLDLHKAFADDRSPERVLADWGGGRITLPLTVAINRDGQICGRKHGLLGTDQLKHWSRTCSR